MARTPKFLYDLAVKLRQILPKGVPTFLPEDWEYPQTVVVHGRTLPAHRCWPLRVLSDGRKPQVTSKHRSRNGSRPNHYGADLFYKYDPMKDPPMKIGDSGREKNWWIPEGTRVIAQAEGDVEIAGNSRTGYRVWVRHDGGLATGGFHMTEIFHKSGDTVFMGEDIGIVGDNPIDEDPDHLHTELYDGSLKNYPRGSLDPELFWVGATYIGSK